MTALAPDSRTAVVTLTHDPKLDDPALRRALRSHAFYIGALGSRRTHAGRLERLGRLGLAEAEIAPHPRPGRADIGAVSPAEIALSILAEVAAGRGAALAPAAREAAPTIFAEAAGRGAGRPPRA